MAGLLAVIAVVFLHLKLAARPGPELTLIGTSVLIGLVFDSMIVGSGWIRYPSGMFVPGIAPYWILGMWALFATTLNASMNWMKGRLLLASLMGAVFGPLSYMGGARLGGLEFVNFEAAMMALAAAWAVAMPLLVISAGRFNGLSSPESRPEFQLADGNS